uniref:ATP synthase F0 subunit 6 n=1 Tax=Pseudochauhanea macrorchis TaxID=1086615 RepID=H6U4R7_PSEMH|nr:ATP synthase F0 subunit 6 [Pseudochauhanea macrorchis]AEO93253.1 ATP synthase F0 subunit 6 [Pseudochauhanea macrorchis]
MSRLGVVLSHFYVLQSFHYSYFTVVCAVVLVLSQVPYFWTFNVIYVVIPFLMGVRPLGIAFYNLVNFIKMLIMSVPKELPSVVFSVVITPFIFIGECCSQMLRPITLILRLLVNLTFAYIVSLTVGSQFIEKFLSGGFGLKFILIYSFSTFYFFYEIFMSFLLTYVSHVMMLSLISDLHHVLHIKFFK